MAIEDTYKEVFIADAVSEQLRAGENISASDLIEDLDDSLSEKDLTIPQFVASDFRLERKEESSAAKNNTTLSTLRQDIRVLYKNLIELTKVSIGAYERWGLESKLLEKQLIDMEDRIRNLLLMTQDTEGYHSILIDNFTDLSKTDTDFTTAKVDIAANNVGLGPSEDTFERVFLNDLDLSVDVFFKLRTTAGFLSRQDQIGSDLTDIFSQQSKTWWTNINMSKSGPVTCELTVRLDPKEDISLNKIVIELHDSVESSPITITPLYSIDNVTFIQLPSNTFTLETKSIANFEFEEIQAQYIKFILNKRGPDQSSSKDSFSYQFGFKSIAFYSHSFDSDTTQYFVSIPLSVLDHNGDVRNFEKVTLETCEKLETDTNILYYMTFSNDSEVPLGSNFKEDADWFPITPINRVDPISPPILDIGDINEISIGDDETVQVSYDGRADPITDSDFINPAQEFHLLSQDTDESILDDTVTANSPRYVFVNTNDRILNYQIKTTDYTGSGSGSALDVNEEKITIFRNVGTKGVDYTSTTSTVRDIEKGWGFSDPYYICIIEVQNPDGMAIDVGNQPIIIDGAIYTSKIGNSILTGKTAASDGIHRIKVHKNNWMDVPSGTMSGAPTDLEELKALDLLYPYNHKLIIEGYNYSPSYSATDEQIYVGADVFAELIMKKVSSFDLLYNTTVNNYELYAIDLDAPNTHNGTGGNPNVNDATKVFLLKVDEGNPDIQNEAFMIRFKQINLLQKYLRLRADFVTSNDEISPGLTSYKIKLG